MLYGMDSLYLPAALQLWLHALQEVLETAEVPWDDQDAPAQVHAETFPAAAQGRRPVACWLWRDSSVGQSTPPITGRSRVRGPFSLREEMMKVRRRPFWYFFRFRYFRRCVGCWKYRLCLHTKVCTGCIRRERRKHR